MSVKSTNAIQVAGLGDSASANRAVIQRAVDAANEAGGGRVEIPVGAWVTGSIELKSGVELHLPKGAVLKGSANRADYNADDAFPGNLWSASEEWSGGHLVYGYRVENVAITGEGTLDGNGTAFFGECDADSCWPWYKYGLKLHPTDRDWFRPGIMVAFFESSNIRIEGVTLANTPCWTVHVRCSDGLAVRGVTIDADRTIANSDGLSVDCTRNVVIENCTIRTGDDSIAIRASCAEHAATNFCENIAIRGCDIWSCCYGVRFGIGSGTIRNVDVSDVRIHEASEAGFTFTPAWIPEGRSCYIENIRVRDCTVAECVRPVSAEIAGGDWRIAGIRFENCVFRTLLPIEIEGGGRVEFAFRNCTRQPIERLTVRHRLGWNDRGIINGKSVFANVSGDAARVSVEDCKPVPLGSAGVLVLSFDDRNFDDWVRAIPLFDEYDAHATFFVSGDFDRTTVAAAKKLMAHGHSIGLHGRNHANVPDSIAKRGENGYYDAEIAIVRRQCDVSYIPVRNFAYPNCRCDDASDRFMLSKFDRLRGGLSGIRPYDPNGEKRSGLRPLATDDRVFFPVSELPKRRRLDTILIGEAYNTDIDDVARSVKRAGERKEVLVLASHGISPDAVRINMKTEWLEKILAAAREHGVCVLGFDELPLD